MNENTSYFSKIWSNKYVSKFAVYISQFIWFKKFDQI